MSWARLLKRVFDIDIERCPNCGSALKIIAAPSAGSGQASKIRRWSSKSSAIWACHPARRRVESISSKRSEEPKTACQRKLPASLALSSSGKLRIEPFPCLPTALRAARYKHRVFHQAERELTPLPVLRYGFGHRKGRLKILSITR